MSNIAQENKKLKEVPVVTLLQYCTNITLFNNLIEMNAEKVYINTNPGKVILYDEKLKKIRGLIRDEFKRIKKINPELLDSEGCRDALSIVIVTEKDLKNANKTKNALMNVLNDIQVVNEIMSYTAGNVCRANFVYQDTQAGGILIIYPENVQQDAMGTVKKIENLFSDLILEEFKVLHQIDWKNYKQVEKSKYLSTNTLDYLQAANIASILVSNELRTYILQRASELQKNLDFSKVDVDAEARLILFKYLDVMVSKITYREVNAKNLTEFNPTELLSQAIKQKLLSKEGKEES